MQNYKWNTTTKIPNYIDGKFRIFEIRQTEDVRHEEYLHDTTDEIWFEELSISDRLRFEAEEREKKITYKLRIPQTKTITSLHVLKIGQEYHKVYNAYHFTNKDGFKQTDLTLLEYPRVRLEEEKCKNQN